MKTPTHFLLTALIAERWPGSPAACRRAACWGAVIPDFPIIALSCGVWVSQCMIGGESLSTAIRILDDYYYHDPAWCAAHNLLHSPLSLLSLALGSGLLPHSVRHGARAFLLGCAFHSALDLLTHYDDGPLLYWPFDTTTRFHGPVSHWDPAHWGQTVMMFEAMICAVALCGLAANRVRDACEQEYTHRTRP